MTTASLERLEIEFAPLWVIHPSYKERNNFLISDLNIKVLNMSKNQASVLSLLITAGECY
jgi:hypothetical protein